MEFVIPKGLDFAFTIKVMDKENKVSLSLDTLTKATLTILNKETQAKMMSIDMTASTTTLGLLECIIPKAKTAMLEIKRAGVEDNYFLKAGYQGNLNIVFADVKMNINTMLPDIFISPTGE